MGGSVLFSGCRCEPAQTLSPFFGHRVLFYLVQEPETKDDVRSHHEAPSSNRICPAPSLGTALFPLTALVSACVGACFVIARLVACLPWPTARHELVETWPKFRADPVRCQSLAARQSQDPRESQSISRTRTPRSPTHYPS